MKRLEKCFFSCVSTEVCRSKFVKREKAWRAFHQLRVGELGKMWCDFFGHDGIPKLSPLVYQHVNQRLYSDLIKCYLSIHLGDRTTEMFTITADEENIQRYADEENIQRYAAGYVPFKLLKKYEKSASGCIIVYNGCRWGRK